MARLDPVAAGQRDTYVRLEQGTQSAGRSSRPILSWSLLESVWANKRDTSGAERLRAQQVEAQFDTTFTIPYSAAMDPTLVDVPTLRRVVYAERVFDIVFARLVGRRQGIELATRAGTRLGETP